MLLFCRTMLVSCNLDEDNEEYPQGEEMYRGLTILHLTCVFDQDHIMKYFLRFGLTSSLNAKTMKRQSLMHICAWYGTYNTMNLLVRHGVSVEEKNESGHFAIHLASMKGHYICLQSLLKAGADPNAGDNDGNTALHSAVVHDQIECAEELFKFEDVSMKIKRVWKIRKFIAHSAELL